MRPVRLTAVLTHPIQYYSPWFRHIAAHVPSIQLTVLYAARPTPEQQGIGFGESFTWDVPLIDGYDARFARPSRPSDRFDAASFRGVDVPDIGDRIGETRPDALLVPGWHSAVLVRALVAARRLGIPVIYRGDTHLGNAPAGWRRTAWRLKTRTLLSAFSAYLSVGVRARDYLMDLGIDHRRVFDAPHAVDNDRFAAGAAAFQTEAGREEARRRLGVPASAFVVLFVGKFEDKKRPLDLLRAATCLPSRPTLLFAGAGALEPALREQAAARRLDARFLGFVNQGQLGPVYAAADCLALPSDWGETWGLVVNEALATGLPVVVSDRVGCAPDLVDSTTGATFQFGNPADLATAIETVARRGGAVYAPACRARAARYTFDRATEGLVQACEAVTTETTPELPPVRVVACCGHMVTVTGLERHTFETLRAARAKGASVHCIVNSWEHHRITPLANEIGATWSVGSYAGSLRRHHLTPRRVAGMAVEIANTSAGLLRDVRRTRATTVLVPDHVAVVRNAPALAWLRLRGRARIVMGLGNAPDTGRFYYWYWRTLQNALIDHFVCNSRFTRQELLARGVDEAKTSWTYNVLPPRRRGVAAQPIERRVPGRIVYVGQIIPGKGLDLLLEAAGLLVARGLDVSIDVVGPIDGWTVPEYLAHRAAIRARAGRADLAGRVSFLGWQEDVMPIVARASVHCAPSLPAMREGFGYVNLEAKQVGVPSVVFASGAFPEIITHRGDGWICGEPTPAALAEGLEYFLSSPERLRTASVNARRSADTFDPNTYAEHWWRVLRGIDSPAANGAASAAALGEAAHS